MRPLKALTVVINKNESIHINQMWYRSGKPVFVGMDGNLHRGYELWISNWVTGHAPFGRICNEEVDGVTIFNRVHGIPDWVLESLDMSAVGSPNSHR